MYFGIGGHPAIRVNYEDNDTKGNYVLFDKKTLITYYELNDDGSFITRKKTLGEVGKIEVDKAFFRKYKTLICDNNFNHLTLKERMEEELALDFILSIYLFGVSLMLVILFVLNHGMDFLILKILIWSYLRKKELIV